MARTFIKIMAGMVLVIIGGMIVLGYFFDKAANYVLQPEHAFAEMAPPPAPDYDDIDNWAAHPDASSLATVIPDGIPDLPPPDVDIFFVHPTTYYSRARWNSPVSDPQSRKLVDLGVIKHQSSAFNAAGRIFAPRYRQATLYSFLGPADDGPMALALAYEDVLRAFDQYMATWNEGRGFIIAGHSQGSFHVLRLLKERVSGRPLRGQLIAAYVIGWQVSIKEDLPEIADVPPCNGATDTGCLVSWNSFGEGGDPTDWRDKTAPTVTLSGNARGNHQILCMNPLTWSRSREPAAADLNLGSLAVGWDRRRLEPPVPQASGARCGEDGILYVTEPETPNYGLLTMQGRNMHLVDISLFYMNLRRNARERALAFLAGEPVFAEGEESAGPSGATESRP